MADKKKTKRVNKISPQGVAVWPYLNKPDDFKGKEKYKVSLAIPEDEAEKFKAYIDDRVDAAWDHYAEEKGEGKLRKFTKAYPYTEEEDDDDEPTGRLLFNFSQNAEIKGQPVKIALFDSEGTPTTDRVYGGSEIKVAFPEPNEFRGFYMMNSTSKIGVTLDIAGVQVIELVTGGASQRSASSLGFEKEDGYVTDGATSGGDDDTDEDDACGF